MQAIREIRDVTSQELKVTLPEEFLKQRVEIIILPVEDDSGGVVQKPPTTNLEQEIEALSWDMGERLYAAREQLHER